MTDASAKDLAERLRSVAGPEHGDWLVYKLMREAADTIDALKNQSTSKETCDLSERAQSLYDTVKLFPEKLPNGGFMELLALRNIVPELLSAISSLRKSTTGETGK